MFHHERVARLDKFEHWLFHRPEEWARRMEVLGYYRAMIESRRMRTRPLSIGKRLWIFKVDIYTAARELFRLEYTQRCEKVSWSPDDPA